MRTVVRQLRVAGPLVAVHDKGVQNAALFRSPARACRRSACFGVTRRLRDEDTFDRVAARVASSARETAGQGEGTDASPRRARRGAAAHALDVGGGGVSLRRAPRA